MKNIYMHIGSHKSASKTLQRNLRMNLEVLRRDFNCYRIDDPIINKSDVGIHFRRLSRSMLYDSPSYNESLKRAKDAFDDLIVNVEAEHILISWEGFLGHSALDRYGGIYTHSRFVADSLKIICSGYNARLLIVVRRQDDFIESCYLQQIKENRSLGFAEFTQMIDIGKISWVNVVRPFVECFGDDFSVCPFEYIKEGGSLGFIEYCLSSLLNRSFKAVGFSIIEQANASFSKTGVDISRELLPKLPRKRRAELNKILFQEFSSIRYGKAKYFGGFERQLIKSHCFNSNKTLFDKHIVKEVSGRCFEMSNVENYWLCDKEE